MQFAGKFSLASVDAHHPPVFATPATAPDGGVPFPAMAATSVGRDQTWIAYATDTGLIIQMGNLLYLAQEDATGTVVATDDITKASRFAWAAATDPATTALTIAVAGRGWQPLRYGFDDVGVPSYLVYALGGAPSPQPCPFVRAPITPSLATIQSTKSAIGLDLRDVDLSSADLGGVDASRVDLTAAVLDGAHFVAGSLAGATLEGASLRGTDFTSTSLDGATFDGSDVRTVVWGPGSRAPAASFVGCTGIGTKIGSPVIADWTNADLSGSDLSGADLTNVDLSGARLERCVLTGARLETTNLTGAVLGGVSKSVAAVLSFAYLTNVNFDRANCFGVSFAFASLFGASTNLTETATMEQVDFSNAYLEGIDLSGAVLRGSRFDNACLISADFTTADLGPTSDGSNPTSMAGACLHGAQFTQAKLTGADLSGATVAFDRGSVDVRYCDSNVGPFPPPPDFLPIRHGPTTGLDDTTLRADTICPNGVTYGANQEAGHPLRASLTTPNPASQWVPVRCLTSVTETIGFGAAGAGVAPDHCDPSP